MGNDVTLLSLGTQEYYYWLVSHVRLADSCLFLSKDFARVKKVQSTFFDA
jgi:hypothetical protein